MYYCTSDSELLLNASVNAQFYHAARNTLEMKQKLLQRPFQHCHCGSPQIFVCDLLQYALAKQARLRSSTGTVRSTL